jgi:hypothetical protein
LYVATSFRGVGLTDCDASGDTLNWDETTGRFTCGVDESSGSGLDINTGDARYVNVSGDTMTGALVINDTGSATGGLLLNVLGTISGATIRATNELTSSGMLIIEGVATFNDDLTVNSGATIYGTLSGAICGYPH